MGSDRPVAKEPSQWWAVVSVGCLIIASPTAASTEPTLTLVLAGLVITPSVNHLMNWAKYHFGRWDYG